MCTDANGFRSLDLRETARAIPVLVAAALAGTEGCATKALLNEENSNASAFYQTPILKDSIFALGKPDAALAAKMGAPEAVAFLGRKGSYVLVEGGDQITQLALSQLDPGRIGLDDRPARLYLKEGTIWGTITITYAVAPGVMQTAAEVRELAHFTTDVNGLYRLEIPVKGWTSPAVDPGPGAKLFTQTRDVAFYNPPTSSPPPDLSKYVKLPLAIALDAATAPVVITVAGLFAVLRVVDVATGHGNVAANPEPAKFTGGDSRVKERIAYWEDVFARNVPVGTRKERILAWARSQSLQFRELRGEHHLTAYLERVAASGAFPCSEWTISVEIALDAADASTSNEVRRSPGCGP